MFLINHVLCLVGVSYHVLVRHLGGLKFYTFAHHKFSASFLVHGSTTIFSLQKLCEKTSRFCVIQDVVLNLMLNFISL
jgi:hypothetical protein